MEIWAGLILGYLGSLHCAGMCGPIALALTGRSKNRSSFFWGRLFYNSGRIITYSALGALFGLLGSSIIISSYQQQLSIFTGILILILLVFSFLGKKIIILGKLYREYTSLVKKPLAKLFKTKNYASFLGIGMLNGLLPCGFVYLAIAGSLTTGSIGSGIMFMALFGAGTLPVMLGISIFGNFLKEKVRIPYAKILPALSILIAIVLILRGLNLGIPFLSPELKVEANQTELICH